MVRIKYILKKVAAKPILSGAVPLLFTLFAWMLWETYQADNFGFASKTFWDWMELLGVPASLAAAGAWFAHVQKRTELEVAEKERKTDRKIALERQRQQTLENYLDRMKELILNNNLSPDTTLEVKRMARAWTFNVLRELTPKRNRQVIQFLQEAQLLKEGGSVDLSFADLSGAALSKTNLMGVSLKGARLNNTNLSGAFLTMADLSGAQLSKANLSGADLVGSVLIESSLIKTDLTGAHLERADLGKAFLFKANLSGADLKDTVVSEEQLSQAILSDATIMTDGSTYLEWQQKRRQSQEQSVNAMKPIAETPDTSRVKDRIAEQKIVDNQDEVIEGDEETVVSNNK